jgi:4-amino-4-deoxy-L-arabinose transferase-like glycosyltransferase
VTVVRILAGPALLWLVVVAVALWARPLMPVDETRYLSVAWEMWLRGDLLVPHLNGQPYHHKPPLLFWLIELGWWIGGVSELWGRLVAPLFGLANLALTVLLGRRLWPERPEIARDAPWLLIGGLWWAGYTTLTMFDMMVACFALIGLLGVVEAWQGRRLLGWVLFVIGVAGGVLSKGPVILVFLLPAGVLAPLWMTRDRPGWLAWYGALLLALLIGAGLALAWALPAAKAGGEAYGNALLWGQTSGRVVKSFAHRREIWFYFAALPAMLLPWTLYPPLWRGAWAAWCGRRVSPSAGARFCAVVTVPAFAVLSLVSGKQPQYLMPLLPILALALAAALSAAPVGRIFDRWLPPLVVALSGIALIVAIVVAQAAPDRIRAPEWLDELSLATGIALLAAATLAVAIARTGPSTGRRPALIAFAALSVGAIVIAHVGARATIRPYFDLGATAAELSRLQRAGRPIAIADEYHGQFNFLARLERPIAVVPRAELAAWAKANPTGAVVLVEAAGETGEAMHRQVYRGRALAIRAAASLITPSG